MTDYAIEMSGIVKEFNVLNHREGLKGSLMDLFSRDYRTVTAVDNISIKIPEGQIVGYLGPNGAGKSTTIKMMTGVLEPTRGDIIVNGNIPYKNRTKNAENIGVVFGPVLIRNVAVYYDIASSGFQNTGHHLYGG